MAQQETANELELAYSCTLSTSGFFKIVGSSFRKVPDRDPTVSGLSSEGSTFLFWAETSLLFCLFLPLTEPFETTLRVVLLLVLLTFVTPFAGVLLLLASFPEALQGTPPLLFTGLATDWLRV